MKILQLLAVTAIATIAWATSAFSAAPTWNLDKAHSGIYFSIDHIFSKVNGHFNEFNTDIAFDPADLAGSKFDFEIQVGSIDTFKSSKISDQGNGMYDVAGTLTIKEKDYNLTLPLKLEGIKEHPAKKGTDVAGFNGRVTIDRLAHGVGAGKFYDMGVVGKDVDVFVTLEVLSN